MDRKTKGKYGEDLAEKYLFDLGLEIVERNFRYKRSEIDLICLHDNNLLIFVEVKFRKNANFGEPESFVNKSQQQLIKKGAEAYIYGINWTKDIRFDIVTINQESGEFQHLPDAFY
ncbi:MAG: YraN family protein [Cyclobacteriaceae bacterium]